MPGPKLSIIIPVYNAQEYIAGNLSALQRQTFQNFEAICVNDGSTDGSLEILQRFAQQDPRIRCISLEKNEGPGGARNHGLAAAKGEYIAFMDADDQIDRDLHARAVARAEESGADQVVWGITEEYFNRRGRHIKTVPIMPAEALYTTQEQIASATVELEAQTLFGYVWNSLYKADIIRQHNIRFPGLFLYEDYFFNLAYIRHTRVLAVMEQNGSHYFRRLNPSVTSRFYRDYYDLSYKRVETFYQYCREHQMLTPDNLAMLGNRLLRYTLSAMNRNISPQSGMDARARREWIERELYGRPLYDILLKKSYKTNLANVIMRNAICKKRTWLLVGVNWLLSSYPKNFTEQTASAGASEEKGAQETL